VPGEAGVSWRGRVGTVAAPTRVGHRGIRPIKKHLELETFVSTQPLHEQNVTNFADLGKEMWSYLTGKGAAINYQFVDMTVEVPRETGADAPRASWRLNGTLRITTAENASAG